MNSVYEAAIELEDFCREQDWTFCFIGGIAVQRWGEPRLTLDADLPLLTGFGSESIYIKTLLVRFDSRIPEAPQFALENRVLLLRAGNGVPLDVALAAMPFEERAIQRASDFRLDQGRTVRTCSAEDLVVFKVFAGRPHDWHDVQTTLLRQAEVLDVALVRNELEPLVDLLDEPQRLDQFEQILSEIGGHS